MDITKIAEVVAQSEQGTTSPVYQPNGEPYLAADGKTPCTFTCVGKESKRVKLARDKQTKRMLRDRRGDVEVEDVRQNRVELAAAGLIEWTGWEANGAPWPCTPENVATLLDSADHLLEQAERLVDGHARFFGKPSRGSSATSDTKPD
jgi:hypothetical protein